MTPKPTANTKTDSHAAVGALLCLGAFAIWGFFPVFFKLVADVPAIEVLGHRIVWSVLFAGILLTVCGQWRSVFIAIASRRIIAILFLSAALVSVNWGVFIWAVGHNRVLESSLGYFINPLVNVLLGTTVLRERLSTKQWIAVGIAAFGVGYQVVALGVVPWVSLILAVSWGLYGMIRKVVEVESLPGLFIETLLLAPLALIYLGSLVVDGTGTFGTAGLAMDGLLVFAGVLTAVPLILFVAGAQRIKLTTLGLLQYTVPTSHFLLAVVAYGEPFGPDHFVTFACIWIALVIYSIDAMRRQSKSNAST